jgi:hypothetical protein
MTEPPDPALKPEFHELPDVEPPEGWQDRVLAAIDAGEVPSAVIIPITQGARRLRLAAGIAISVIAAAAGIVIYLVVGPGTRVRPAGEPLALSMEVRDGTAVVRGAGTARIGDVIIVHGRWGAEGELRIYRDDREVVLQCRTSAEPGCRADGGAIAGEHKITAPGKYRAVIFNGATGPPTGNLDRDVAGHTGEYLVLPPEPAH